MFNRFLPGIYPVPGLIGNDFKLEFGGEEEANIQEVGTARTLARQKYTCKGSGYMGPWQVLSGTF